MKLGSRFLAGVMAVLSLAQPDVMGQTSSLEPPLDAMSNNMPVATMKSLNQIEPRTLISQDMMPFTITRPGSYYMSMPITNTMPGSNGINVLCGNVRIDLNGFPLLGCDSGFSGITVAPGSFNVVIKNGVITDWNGFGIAAAQAPEMTIADIKSINNGRGGIYAGDSALIERCSAYGNGMNAPPTNPPQTDGIRAGAYSTISECKARFNKGANIHTYEHSRVIGCTATESTEANGIWAEDYCTIRDCTVARNNNQGIRVGSKCRVVGNTCGENGTNNPTPGQIGGISVEGNNSLIENNIVSGNNTGIRLMGSGNLIIHNSASKNIPGPDFFFGVPPEDNFVGNLSAFTAGNGVSFSNITPWANFSFQ